MSDGGGGSLVSRRRWFACQTAAVVRLLAGGGGSLVRRRRWFVCQPAAVVRLLAGDVYRRIRAEKLRFDFLRLPALFLL